MGGGGEREAGTRKENHKSMDNCASRANKKKKKIRSGIVKKKIGES